MNHDTVKNDYFWMAKAIQLAQQGRFTTSPNPRVGCVIVDENNQLLGQGYHIQAGTPHAEVHALRQASNARPQGAKGATAYVTLEPCSHFGRTPPCAVALVEAKVARVVIAMTDPNPNVCGNGISILQEAGIEVVSEVMAAEAAALNPGFIKRMLTGRPFVRVKLGISLDGKIALQNGVSDNPSLLVREKEAQFEKYPLDHIRQPARVVVDSKSKLSRDYTLFNDGNITFTATSQAHPDTATQHYLQLDEKDGKLNLHSLMSALGDKQYNEVWVEAGPGLAGALLQEGLVDELICYQAPKLLGDKGVSMVNLPAFTSLNECISLSLIENRQVGNDIKLIFRPDVSNTRG